MILTIIHNGKGQNIEKIANKCKNGHEKSCNKLISIAITNKHYYKRKTAVLRISDQEALCNIAINDNNSNVREVAVKRITNQEVLRKIVENDYNKDVQIAALGEIVDQGILVELARSNEYIFIRNCAVQKIENQEILKEIAEHDYSNTVRKTAINGITNVQFLASIEKNNSSEEIKILAELRRRICDSTFRKYFPKPYVVVSESDGSQVYVSEKDELYTKIPPKYRKHRKIKEYRRKYKGYIIEIYSKNTSKPIKFDFTGKGSYTESLESMNKVHIGSVNYETIYKSLLSRVNDADLVNIYLNTDIEPLLLAAMNKLTEININNLSVIAANHIQWISIPQGTFLMGSPAYEVGRYDNEAQHEVTLDSFKMSKYEITRELYDLYEISQGDDYPFAIDFRHEPQVYITWDEATCFAKWIGCRLPTEAEWEYACRAGTNTPFNTGNELLSSEANFYSVSDSKIKITHYDILPVGSYPPNAWGLYDMHGNVMEWCNDWYGLYTTTTKKNPQGTNIGKDKIVRGGSFKNPAKLCRSAMRIKGDPLYENSQVGFRLVKSK